jgi:hypothetical protein
MSRLVKAKWLPAGAPNWRVHGLSSPVMWFLVLLCQSGLWLFPNNEGLALVGGLAFLVAYHLLYASLKKNH